jgi:hypothetical protein
MLHILVLEINLIYVSKMSDVDMHTLFHKDTFKMVKGAMVLMKGFHIGTLYKLLVSVELNGCNTSVVPEVDSTRVHLIQTNFTVLCQFDLTMVWN